MSFIELVAQQHRNYNLKLGDVGESALGWQASLAAAGFVALTQENRRAAGLSGGITYTNANSQTVRTKAAGGKFYAECDFISGTKFGTNIPPAFGLSATNAVGTDSNIGTGTQIYVMAGAAGYSGAARAVCGVGDNIGIAVDMTNSRAWLRRNGVWVNGGDPALDTLPDFTSAIAAGSYRLIATGNQAGVANTYVWFARFGASQFLYPMPAGFTPWG